MKPINQWTVAELHEELKSRGVSVAGLKADLYERLRWELKSSENPSDSAPVNGAAAPCCEPTEEDRPPLESGSIEPGVGDLGSRFGEGNSGESERGADIQVGGGNAGVELWEGGMRAESDEDHEPDLKFKLDDDEEEEDEDDDGEEDMSDGVQDALLGERSPSSCVGDEPDLVEEDEGDDLLGNEDLEPHSVRSGDEGRSKREQQPARCKDASVPAASVQRTAECMDYDIPRDWLPMPLIWVKNISEDCDLEALKEVLCRECEGMEICSVHIDHSLDSVPSALVRIAPPQLPSLVSHKSPLQTSVRAVDGSECKSLVSNRLKFGGQNDIDDGRAVPLTKSDRDIMGNDEPGSILEAAGEVGDVKKAADFCVRKLQSAGAKLGDSTLELEAPILRTTLFVHNLQDEYNNDDASFKTSLRQHGEIVRCFCVRNKDGSSKDYGFVEFAVPSSAAQAKAAIDSKSSEALQRFRDAKMNAMQGDHGRILPEKRLRCEWSFNQTIPSLFSKICYVSNLPVGFMDREALRVVFEPYGEILSCNIRSRTGMGPGCGFVEFAQGHDAEKAMRAMNGTHAENLGYILVSLVNPAKFPGDSAVAANQRAGGFPKRPRSDVAPMRERGFPRPSFMMDPRSRSMLRGRGRGRGGGGPMQPHYAYGGYQMQGGFQSQGYQPGYYDNGYSFGHQPGGGYGNNFYPPQGNYPEQYHGGDRSPDHHMGYKNSRFAYEGWGPMEGAKNHRGSHLQESSHGSDHGYGHQSGHPQGYSSYQSGGYGSPHYGPSDYGPSHQTHSQGHFPGGGSNYQSSYGGYHNHGGGYHRQQDYGVHGSQEYGSGNGPGSGFDHSGYLPVGDRRGFEHGFGDFVGEMGRDHKRPRY